MEDSIKQSQAEPSDIKQVIVCADDYGLSPGISAAIRRLIAAGRITATSCMPILPEWRSEAKEIADLSDRADIGLHFTLTNLNPLTKMPNLAPTGRLPSLKRLMSMSLMGRLRLEEIRDELVAQLDAFEAGFGGCPDYLDSHHHVHTLPTIRSVVVDVFAERLAPSGAYLRWPGDNLRTILSRRTGWRRALLLNHLASPLRRTAQLHGLLHNDGFTGLYSKSSEVSYSEIFPSFLRGIRGKTILLCHPGMVDDKLRQRDSLLQPRESENYFFNSQRYMDILAEGGITLTRFH